LDLAFQPDAVIQIFDRYGKFIKEIKPSSAGWDGNYNGQPLPSTDYWFQVTYLLNGEQQVFKAHFSMKR
jgi:gliding motility-associated-like protein